MTRPKPKDIAAGDWDTAFALLRRQPCDEWKAYLRKHGTLREALLSCSGPVESGVYPYAARAFLEYTLDAPVAVELGCCSMRPFTDAEIDAIVAHLRARFLEAP